MSRSKKKTELVQEIKELKSKLAQFHSLDSNKCSKTDRALIILNHMFQFVGLLDLSGNLLEINQPALDVVGAKCYQVIGKPFWEGPWWSNSPEVKQQIKDAVTRATLGEIISFEAEHYLGTDLSKKRIIDFSIKPVRNETGEVIYLLPEGRDITEKKAAESQLKHKNQELAEKHAAIVQTCHKADAMFLAYSEVLPGKELDCKYKINNKLGAGGFGIVYQATHLGLNREVAIKIFHPSIGSRTIDDLDRFRLEGISACLVNHPNAVEILDAGISSEGIAYLVMELLEGHTLKAELKIRWRLSYIRAIEIIMPICGALIEAHRNGIIHRDIKPDNIFLHNSSAGEIIVKLIDFGIAKLVDNSFYAMARDLTAKGTVIGTPAYIAPERATNQLYDGRTDIYSLGITFYEMLTGRVPFDPDEIGVVEALIEQINTLPPSPRKFNNQIPAEIEAIVLSMLSKDPNLRPTAEQLSNQLNTILQHQREIFQKDNTTTIDDAQDFSQRTTKLINEFDPLRTKVIPQKK